MAADRSDIDAMLDGWRQAGADRMDPLRFHRIVALQRRASAREGIARRRLEARLAVLADAYARDVASRPPGASALPPTRGPLGALVDDTRARSGEPAPGPAYPELAALDGFRAMWAALRSRSQVRRSLAPPPSGAGPLNSAALAHRALALMGGLSPDYLHRFLDYVDALSSLESMQGAGVLPGADASPAPGTKPRPRPRKRRT